jgi:hypothetical protein
MDPGESLDAQRQFSRFAIRDASRLPAKIQRIVGPDHREVSLCIETSPFFT